MEKKEDHDSVYQEGKTLALNGLEAEKKRDIEKAFSLQQQAVECFIYYLNNSPKSYKELDGVRGECLTALNRAEAYKKALIQGGKLPTTFNLTSHQAQGKSSKDEIHERSIEQMVENMEVNLNEIVKLDDIVGLDEVKQIVRNTIYIRNRFPTLSKNVKPVKGVLLFGPPGTGKTHIARAIATQCQAKMFMLTSGLIGSKWHGDSERMMTQLFARARSATPSIIFMDEIDWLCSEREGDDGDCISRLKAELLVQMDGLSGDGKVLVIGATNKPFNFEHSFRRRFQARIYVSLPDENARKLLFEKKLFELDGRHVVSEKQLNDLSMKTKDYSASDIDSVVSHSKMLAVQKTITATHFKELEDGKLTPCASTDPDMQLLNAYDVDESILVAPPVTYDDLLKALLKVTTSIDQTNVSEFEKYNEKFGGSDE